MIRNTLTPRSVELTLDIRDPDDDAFDVTVNSDRADILPESTHRCGPGTCPLTLTPFAEETAVVAATVSVSDGRGGEASASFTLSVEPLRVTAPGDDGAGSLRRVVGTTQDGDVVGFDMEALGGAPATIDLVDQIELDRSLTLEGPGVDGLTVRGGAARVFEVAGDVAVTIRDLTVADGNAPLQSVPAVGGNVVDAVRGGCILVGPGSQLALRRVTVTRCAAMGDRAAGGGVANLGGTLLLEASVVEDNRAEHRGGGVFNASVAGVGGVTTMNESDVAANQVTLGSGGGIASDDRAAAVILRATRVMGNTAPAGSGGGIFATGNVVVDPGTVVTDNRAGEDGGGIYLLFGSAVVDSASIEGNAATEGGGIYNFGSTLTIEGATLLAGNVASIGGGGIAVRSEPGLGIATTSIANSTIRGNRAETGRGGGIRSLNGSRLTLSGSQVLGNTAVREGGGLHASERVIVESTSIVENAALSGGGLSLTDGFGPLEAMITDSEVSDNETTSVGGGILARRGTLRIESSNVERNVSGGNGGGVYALDAHLAVVDATVLVANRAASHGGGIYAFRATVRVVGTSCMVLGNVADADGDGSGRGGGIFDNQSDLDAVPVTRVCLNSPDDIAS